MKFSFNRSLSPLLYVVLGAICISFSAVFAKLASTPADVSAFYRAFVGGVCLLAVANWRHRRSLTPLLRRYLKPIIAGGLFLSLDLMTWHRAIDIVGPGIATILINFQVFVLALVGYLFYNERLTFRFAVSVPLSLLGLCFLVGINPGTIISSDFTGTILGLTAALWLAFYTLIVRKVQTESKGTSGAPLMAFISLASACFTGITLIWEGTPFTGPAMQDVLWLTMYGIISQAIGWLLISEGLPGVSNAQAGLTILIMPALAFLWDIIFFGKTAGVMELSGAVIVLLAIWLGTSSFQGEAGR